MLRFISHFIKRGLVIFPKSGNVEGERERAERVGYMESGSERDKGRGETKRKGGTPHREKEKRIKPQTRRCIFS
jgi:hypothetical protein